MTPWTSFYDLIAPDLPGCSFAAMDIALRQAAIAFCEQSLAWKYTHPDIAVVAATATYNFVPPTQAVVHVITYAAFNGDEIECKAGESNITITDWRNQTGTPAYVLGGATALTLVPTPDAAGTLSIEVALKPSPSGTGIDDSTFNEYREAIIHGALARLMLSQKKPYTNAALAQYHGQQFEIKTGRAGLRQARNFTRAPLQTSIMRRG
ncbi:MAG TPA: hypothetical protein VIU43_08495 [Nitrosospira sp.]